MFIRNPLEIIHLWLDYPQNNVYILFDFAAILEGLRLPFTDSESRSCEMQSGPINKRSMDRKIATFFEQGASCG